MDLSLAVYALEDFTESCTILAGKGNLIKLQQNSASMYLWLKGNIFITGITTGITTGLTGSMASNGNAYTVSSSEGEYT